VEVILQNNSKHSEKIKLKTIMQLDVVIWFGKPLNKNLFY